MFVYLHIHTCTSIVHTTHTYTQTYKSGKRIMLVFVLVRMSVYLPLFGCYHERFDYCTFMLGRCACMGDSNIFLFLLSLVCVRRV